MLNIFLFFVCLWQCLQDSGVKDRTRFCRIIQVKKNKLTIIKNYNFCLNAAFFSMRFLVNFLFSDAKFLSSNSFRNWKFFPTSSTKNFNLVSKGEIQIFSLKEFFFYSNTHFLQD